MSTARKWAIVAVAMTMTAVVMGVVMAGMSLWSPEWLKEFHAGPASVMAATTFNQVGSALVAPFIGYSVGRIPIRNIMLFGLAITAAGLAGVAYADAMWKITLIHALILSVGVVICGPVLCQVLIVRLFQENRGIAIGVVTSGVCISTFTLPPVIGFLLESGYNWRLVELMMVGVVVALVPLVFFVVKEPASTVAERDGPEGCARPSLSMVQILSGKTFLATMMALVPLFVLFNAVYYTLGLYLDSLGAKPTEVSLIVALAGLLAIFGVVSFGSLADRMSHWMLLAISSAALTCGFLLAAVVRNHVVMFIVVPVLDFTIGGLSTLAPAIFAKRYGAANFAMVTGLSRPFFAISSFSPLLAGYLREQLGDYPMVYLALMTCLPVTYIGLMLLRPGQSPSSGIMPSSAGIKFKQV